MEDVSTGGLWMFGLLSQIHKPEIWVERSDADRARTVLEEYEQQATAHCDALAAGEPIFVVCEECGKGSSYPPSQRGTVQDCPQCAAYVDVEDTPYVDGSDFGEAENP